MNSMEYSLNNVLRDSKPIYWHQRHYLYQTIIDHWSKTGDFNQEEVDGCLNLIIGDQSQKDALGVPFPLLNFFEYCVSQANKVGSETYIQILPLLKEIITAYSDLKRLLNSNASDTIGNMILGARGRLKLEIWSEGELDQVLQDWKKIDLEPVSPQMVLEAIINKGRARVLLLEKNPWLLARLVKVFPSILGNTEPFRSADKTADLPEESIKYMEIQDALNQDLSLEQLYEDALNQGKNAPFHRNRRVAELKKYEVGYRCQLCPDTRFSHKNQLSTHHLKPFSEGGTDNPENLIVVCNFHHQELHTSLHYKIEITEQQIRIELDKVCYFIWK